MVLVALDPPHLVPRSFRSDKMKMQLTCANLLDATPETPYNTNANDIQQNG